MQSGGRYLSKETAQALLPACCFSIHLRRPSTTPATHQCHTVPLPPLLAQPVAIVDHVCTIEESALKSLIPDEIGGSHRVEMEAIQVGSGACFVHSRGCRLHPLEYQSQQTKL